MRGLKQIGRMTNMKRTLTVCHAAVNSRVCFALSGINSAHMADSASALPRNPVLAGGTAVLEATAVWGARAVRHNPVFVAGTAVLGMPPFWGATAVWGAGAAKSWAAAWGDHSRVRDWPTPPVVNPAFLGSVMLGGLAVLTAGEN
jgi:hypothetical protein